MKRQRLDLDGILYQQQELVLAGMLLNRRLLMEMICRQTGGYLDMVDHLLRTSYQKGVLAWPVLIMELRQLDLQVRTRQITLDIDIL